MLFDCGVGGKCCDNVIGVLGGIGILGFFFFFVCFVNYEMKLFGLIFILFKVVYNFVIFFFDKLLVVVFFLIFVLCGLFFLCFCFLFFWVCGILDNNDISKI